MVRKTERVSIMDSLSNPMFRRGAIAGFGLTAAGVLYYKMIQDLVHDPDGGHTNRGKEILKYGTPSVGQNIHYYSNHALVYNQQKKTPIWVAEHLTEQRLKGEVNRKTLNFKPDPLIAEKFSASNSDYLGSGWSRGHMNPAGDNKHDKIAMEESFYLTNIVPQNLENNAGFWNRLEMYCRDLTSKYANVYIISGPLTLATEEKDGKNFVKYEVIGKNEVAVPTHLFKLIIVGDSKTNPVAHAAFIIPNKQLGYDNKLTDFQVELSYLEQKAGVQLAPDLDENSVGNLCSIDGCKLMGRTEFELYFIGRKLESATTMARLQKVWDELDQKNLEPDFYLNDLYHKKKEEVQKVSEIDKDSAV